MLCFFPISIHDPIPDDSNKLCVLSPNGTVRAKTSVASFIGFQPTKTHLEDGNYYADKLLFSSCLRIAGILTLNMLVENNVWNQFVLDLIKFQSQGTRNENHLHARSLHTITP